MCEPAVSTTTAHAYGAVRAEDLCVTMGSKVLSEAKLVIASQSREVRRDTKAREVLVRGGTCYGLVGGLERPPRVATAASTA